MIRWAFLLLALSCAACGSEAAGGDAGTIPCGALTCSGNQLCVTITTVSGASRNTVLECKDRPDNCSPVMCGCAVSLCGGASCTCTRASEIDLGCMCNS